MVERCRPLNGTAVGPRFSKVVMHVIRRDFGIDRPCEELKKAEERPISYVIPRLIGVLKTDGRSFKPCFTHGDLWEGKVRALCETGDICLFDAGSCYSPNEIEIGGWRCPYDEKNAEIYTQIYLRKSERSGRTEEWNDRN